MYNNIFQVAESHDKYYDNKRACREKGRYKIKSSNNIWYGSNAGVPFFGQGWDKQVNPRLSRDDLHLRQGSPAINAGRTIEAVSGDIEGNRRPSGQKYDIGAHEGAFR